MDADILASASVCVRTFASASAGFCRQPSANVRVMMLYPKMHWNLITVTVKRVANIHPGGERGFATNSLFRVTHYSCYFNSKKIQNSQHCCIIMTSVGRVRVRSWTKFSVRVRPRTIKKKLADASASARL